MAEYKREKLYICSDYEVDTNGIVYGKNKKALRPSTNHKGYLVVNLMIKGKRVGISVHTLVATQFLVKPGNCTQVNHKNGIKSDNRIDNLEWVTAKQNMEHSINVLGNNFSNTHKSSSNAEKPIIGYNEKETLTFKSLSEANRFLEQLGIKSGKAGIWRAVKKGCRAGGYYWKYQDN